MRCSPLIRAEGSGDAVRKSACDSLSSPAAPPSRQPTTRYKMHHNVCEESNSDGGRAVPALATQAMLVLLQEQQQQQQHSKARRCCSYREWQRRDRIKLIFIFHKDICRSNRQPASGYHQKKTELQLLLIYIYTYTYICLHIDSYLFVEQFSASTIFR